MFLTQPIFLYVLTGIIVILLVWVIRLELRLAKFWRGKKGADVEELMNDIVKSLEHLHGVQGDMGSHITTMDKKLRKSVRGVETVRFNPFKDQGSNQSFAVALMNEEGDGVVFSSLYSRERVSIFAKPVKKQASEFELSAEERDAMKRAMAQHN
jgi:hypothetical protein